MQDARNKETSASVRAQLARAWVDLQEMRLRLAMKPAPKPVDVSAIEQAKLMAKAKRKASAAGPVQPQVDTGEVPPEAQTPVDQG